MNKHVPPPADERAQSARPIGSGETDLKELPAPEIAEARAPKALQPEQRTSAKPRRADEDAAPPKASEPDSEAANPISRAFWTKRRLGIAGIVATVVLGAILWRPWGASAPKISYSIAKVAYGDVTLSVTSTAILEPRDTVEVAAQTGGRLESLLVKSGDHVAKGQPLAHLISEPARDDLIAAQTEFVARQADLARSEADVMEARAALLRARTDAKPGAIDAAEARLSRVLANVDESRALLRAGEVSLLAARSAVQNLDVRAPFEGIVLKTDQNPQTSVRAVARGQSLVTMAADLSQMNLRADFAENTLGRLHLGARAEFTTPAFPRQTFAATLTALDVWPKRESRDGRQIVTYGGVLTGSNPNGVLRPGMSANVAVVVAEAKNALVVPNTALTFVPPRNIETHFPAPKVSSGAHIGRVWVLTEGSPEPRDVSLGLSDGRVTQVLAGSLRANENVVTGALIPAAGP